MIKLVTKIRKYISSLSIEMILGQIGACILLAGCTAFTLYGCGHEAGTDEPVVMEDEVIPGASIIEDSGLIRVGFSQLGAESDWRSANTESILSELTEENGFELIYKNGQQKQVNQITAIRTFIQQGVDYIVLAPVVETGWDTVLQEAKDAGIPVILLDRTIETDKDDLYSCHIGSDFALEGRKACEWLKQFLKSMNQL